MAVNLFEEDNMMVDYVVSTICHVTGACLDPDPLEGCPNEPFVEEAYLDVDNGMVVVDGHTGKAHRIRFTTEPIDDSIVQEMREWKP